MNRTLWLLVAGVVLCAALTAGVLLAQSQPGPAATGTVLPTYKPVSVEAMGTAISAERLAGSDIKIADFFYDWVPIFPDDALRLGLTPRDFVAFRTQPFGSNMVCFIPRSLPEGTTFQESNPVRGTEIFMMGRVGPRILAPGGVATAFRADRIVLGHQEPHAAKVEAKKSVKLTIEKSGPDGRIYKEEWTIEESGKPYWIPDPSDPKNRDKYVRITLQF